MHRFAVIDTETTWSDAVMSIGVAISDFNTFRLSARRYYVLTPYKNDSGMYSHMLYTKDIRPDLECARDTAMDDLTRFLAAQEVDRIFAYNAAFDYQHLPELRGFAWYDIMKLAAYRQYNPCIPHCAPCFGTGRLKRGYGVESVYRMLSGDEAYCEQHNALADAVDELEIMRLLGHGAACYDATKIG